MKRIIATTLLLALVGVPACTYTKQGQNAVVQATVERVDVVEPRPRIVITDREQLTTLLSFFGDIQNEKESNFFGGWEAKFYITFKMEDGSLIKVATAYDDKDWSSGKGDKSLKPGLSRFVEPLFKKT